MKRIQKQCASLRILSDGKIELRSSYNEEVNKLLRNIETRQWDYRNKINLFNKTPKIAKQLVDLCKNFFQENTIEQSIIDLASTFDGDITIQEEIKTDVVIKRNNNGIVIRTPFKREFVDRIKLLPFESRKWENTIRGWFVSNEFAEQAIAITKEFWSETKLDETLVPQAEKVEEAIKLATAITVEEKDIIEMKGGKLYPYQSAGVMFLELKEKGIIADSMGLGKTLQALAFLSRSDNRFPALIVCPAAVKLNWAKEIVKWMGADEVTCDLIDGQNRYEILSNGKKGSSQGKFIDIKPEEHPDILIMNYDILDKYKEVLKTFGFETIIFDESHYIKESSSKRSKAALEIAENIKHKIMLTGTPIMNKPKELWFPLHIIEKEAWPSFISFARRYCDAKKNRWGWNFDGASNLEELNKRIIGHYMVRRRVKDVLKELPEKTVFQTLFEVEAKDRMEYDLALRDFITWARLQGAEKLRKVQRAEALAQMTTLKRLCAQSKIKGAVERIDDFLISREEDQIIVFAHHRSVIEKIALELRMKNHKVGTIEGGDSINARQAIIEQFKDKSLRVIICSIMAAGTGVDGLQVCQNMMFLERTWRPADLLQAEARIHRIGQSQPCFIEYFDMENSIDSKMFDIIERKKKIAATIIDGSPEEAEGFANNVLDSLLNESDEN